MWYFWKTLKWLNTHWKEIKLKDDANSDQGTVYTLGLRPTQRISYHCWKCNCQPEFKSWMRLFCISLCADEQRHASICSSSIYRKVTSRGKGKLSIQSRFTLLKRLTLSHILSVAERLSKFIHWVLALLIHPLFWNLYINWFVYVLYS